jgi:small subunit ribosomal protein S1
VLEKNDKGARLELPYGIEGFAALKHLQKEDGSKAEVGEALDFKVVEFSKEDKRIILSHTNAWKEKDEKPATPPAKKKEEPATVSNENAKTTLGDLDVLAQLRDDMAKNQAK